MWRRRQLRQRGLRRERQQRWRHSCSPVANATVDVWHVSAVGKYSGDDTVNENVSFCTGDDSAFTSKLYFRGRQTTDANGVLYFDSCYPGWYSSRTVHVHLTISVGGVGAPPGFDGGPPPNGGP